MKIHIAILKQENALIYVEHVQKIKHAIDTQKNALINAIYQKVKYMTLYKKNAFHSAVKNVAKINFAMQQPNSA
jgi:hypothetical protein